MGFTESTPELKSINKQIKKAIPDDTKSELNLKIMKSNLWSGLKKLFPNTSNASNVFDNFTPDDINDLFISISIPDQPSSLQPLPTMPKTFNDHHRHRFNFHPIIDDKISGSEEIHGFSPTMLQSSNSIAHWSYINYYLLQSVHYSVTPIARHLYDVCQRWFGSKASAEEYCC
jgi:hypothetical protein